MALAPTSNLDKVREILETGARTGLNLNPPPTEAPDLEADQTAQPTSSPISGAPGQPTTGAPPSIDANLAKATSILTGGVQPPQDIATGIEQASNLDRARAILGDSLDQVDDDGAPNLIQRGAALASQIVDQVIAGVEGFAPGRGDANIFFKGIGGALEGLVSALPLQTRISPVERAPGPARGERFAAVASGLIRNIGARVGGLAAAGPAGFVAGGVGQEFSEIVRERKIDAIKRGDDPDDTFAILRDVVSSPGALGRVGVIAGLDAISLGIATKLAQVTIRATATVPARGAIRQFLQNNFGTSLKELGGNAAVDIIDGLTTAATIALERGEIELSDLTDPDTVAGLVPSAIFQATIGGGTQLGIGLRQRGIAKRKGLEPEPTARVEEPAPIKDELGEIPAVTVAREQAELEAKAKAKPAAKERPVLKAKVEARVKPVEVTAEAIEPRKPLFEQSFKELEESLEVSIRGDTELLESLFGKAGAKRFKQLERQEGSIDTQKADRASVQKEAMIGRLTDPQKKQLFGQEEPELIDPGDVREFKRGLSGLQGLSATALGARLGKSVSDIGTATDPAKMTLTEQVAFSKFREAAKIAEEQGLDLKVVSEAALSASSARFTDPADAEFIIKRFLKTRKEVQPSAPQIEAKRPTLKAQISEAHSGDLRQRIPPVQTEASIRDQVGPSPSKGQTISQEEFKFRPREDKPVKQADIQTQAGKETVSASPGPRDNDGNSGNTTIHGNQGRSLSEIAKSPIEHIPIFGRGMIASVQNRVEATATGKAVVEGRSRPASRRSSSIMGSMAPHIEGSQKPFRVGIRHKAALAARKDALTETTPFAESPNLRTTNLFRAMDKNVKDSNLSPTLLKFRQSHKQLLSIVRREARKSGVKKGGDLFVGSDLIEIRVKHRDFTQVLMDDDVTKLQKIAKAIAEAPPNKAAGLTEKGVMNRLREEQDILTSNKFENAVKVVHPLEDRRRIPFWPAVFDDGVDRIKLMETDPHDYSMAAFRGVSDRIGFIHFFGQGKSGQAFLEGVGEKIRKEGGDVANYRSLISAHSQIDSSNVRTEIEELGFNRGSRSGLRGALTDMRQGSVGTLKAMGLSAAAIPNLPQTAMLVPALVGYRRFSRTMLKRVLSDKATKAEIIQAANLHLATLNFNFREGRRIIDSADNISQIATSLFNVAANHNDLRTGMAGIIWAKDLQAGNGNVRDRQALEIMEYSRKEAQSIVNGTASKELYDSVPGTVVRSTQFTNLTNELRSAFQNNRHWRFWVPFQGYFIGTTRRYSRIAGNFGRSLATGNPREIAAATDILAKSLFGAGVAGFGAITLAGLAFGVETGPDEWSPEEATKWLVKGMSESLMTGPLGAMKFIDPNDSAFDAVGQFSFTASILNEVHQLVTRKDRFKDRTPLEMAEQLVRSRLPITKLQRGFTAAIGSSDPQLEGARREYFEWRKNNKPIEFSKRRGFNEFNREMRLTTDALRRGDRGEAMIHLRRAGVVSRKEEKDPKKRRNISRSLLGRRFLDDLSPIEIRALRDEIGSDDFSALQKYDRILESLAGRL